MSNSLRPHRLCPSRLLCPLGFPRQEYCNGLPFPSPGCLPDPLLHVIISQPPISMTVRISSPEPEPGTQGLPCFCGQEVQEPLFMTRLQSPQEAFIWRVHLVLQSTEEHSMRAGGTCSNLLKFSSLLLCSSTWIILVDPTQGAGRASVHSWCQQTECRSLIWICFYLSDFLKIPVLCNLWANAESLGGIGICTMNSIFLSSQTRVIVFLSPLMRYPSVRSLFNSHSFIHLNIY